MFGPARPPCDEGIIRATLGGAEPIVRGKTVTLAATILGSGMAFVDGSVVNVALPAIQQRLHADAAEAQWVANAYLLMLGALVLVGGGMADRFGRRRVFIAGVLVFTLASIACGLAPSMTALITARAAQGIGAALLTPASLALLGATFDERERGRAVGTWAGCGALMAAAGPVLGGWLVDAVSWRAIFFINVPFALAAVLLGQTFALESRDPNARRLDWLGALTVAAGLAGLTWALTSLPGRSGDDTLVRTALIGGGLLLASFIVAEWRAGREAMMPLGFFCSRIFAGANALTLLLYFALGGALFFIPFGLIRVGGYSTTAAGAALLPFALIMGAGSSLSGALADRWGARLSLTAGPIVAGVGFAVLGFANLSGSSYWTGVLPALAVMSIGMTITVAPLTATVIGAVGEEHAGVASGVNNAVARVAGLLAVAILGVVLFHAFAGELPDLPRARAAEALSALMAGEGDGPAGGTEAFAHAFRVVMWIAGACAAAGGVLGGVLIGHRTGKC